MLWASAPLSAASVEGWLHWRGPAQNGTTTETGLVEDIELGGENHLWTFDMAGRGEAVVHHFSRPERLQIVSGGRGETAEPASLEPASLERRKLVAGPSELGQTIRKHCRGEHVAEIRPKEVLRLAVASATPARWPAP